MPFWQCVARAPVQVVLRPRKKKQDPRTVIQGKLPPYGENAAPWQKQCRIHVRTCRLPRERGGDTTYARTCKPECKYVCPRFACKGMKS